MRECVSEREGGLLYESMCVCVREGSLCMKKQEMSILFVFVSVNEYNVWSGWERINRVRKSWQVSENSEKSVP